MLPRVLRWQAGEQPLTVKSLVLALAAAAPDQHAQAQEVKPLQRHCHERAVRDARDEDDACCYVCLRRSSLA